MDNKKLRKYVNMGLCYNFTDTAEKIGHSKSLVHSYKGQLKEMSKIERNIVIAQAALENVKEAAKDREEKDMEEILDEEMLR